MHTTHSNPNLIKACKAFAKDHFAHFGCLPVEFEFADAVLDFDTYTGFLSKADLDEITGQDPERGLYPVPNVGKLSGESFHQWNRGHFVPTYHQFKLYEAVYEAVITHNLSYNSEIYAHVVDAMSDLLTPELLARNSATMPTERGYFGMEIYYMTALVRHHVRCAANREALLLLKRKGLRVGSVIPGPYPYGSNTFSSLVVEGIDDELGVLVMNAKKRGSRNRWRVVIDASCKRLDAACASTI